MSDNTSQNSPAHQWANAAIAAQNLQILAVPELVRVTPWSQVTRILTARGYLYLKQMAPQFAVEPFILKFLYKELYAPVPEVIAHEESQRWFLMQDAGMRLRETLQKSYQTQLVANILQDYAKLQISTISKNETLLKLGVKDWRLKNLPTIYQELLSQKDFLQGDGLTSSEVKSLSNLQTKFEQTCQHLAEFELPETIEHGDFQDNNILINENNSITFNDWGDVNITHPFFSLGSWLDSASRHHKMSAADSRRAILVDAYLQPWQQFAKIKTLQEAFNVCERIRPVLFAINFCRVASCPGMDTLGQFKGYIANALKEFIKIK